MDETLNKVDNIIRFLDSLYIVVVWKNELGSYSSALVKREDFPAEGPDSLFDVDEDHFTDDMTPSKSLIRLADKPLGNIEDNYVFE